ncbi:hypothetical protein [Spirosoma arcticum]
METVIIQVSDEFAQRVTDTKRKIEEYLSTGDESKKPANFKFVKPKAISARRDTERLPIHHV